MTRWIAVMAMLGAAAVARAAPEPPKPKVVRIGLAIDGPSGNEPQFIGTFRDEILNLVKAEIDVEISEPSVGDWTVAGARGAIDRLMDDPQIDIVLALGLLTSNEVTRRPALPKPSIGAYVIDAGLQGIPFTSGTSGKKNLSYVMSPNTLARDLEIFSGLVKFKKLAALTPKVFLEAVPDLALSAKRQAEGIGIELSVVPAERSAAQVLAGIPLDSEAVYVTPMFQLEGAEMDALIRGLIARKLPSFSLWGRSDVERGILATALPRPDFGRRARRVALNVQRILLGEDAKDLPVLFAREEGLVINMATARAIGFSPSWDALTDAELLGAARSDTTRKLSLKASAEEALAQNLDLAANAEALAASEEEVDRALSPLLPQIRANAVGTMIDADRAANSFGSAPERSLSINGELSQVVYAESAWANLSIQRDLQDARRAGREALKLDTVLQASSAYLSVLGAKSLERIRRENLRKTKSNLGLARVRASAGAASRSEVLRWEAQLANDRRSVIESSAQRNAAEIALNRLLARPLEESFVAEDVALDDPTLFISRHRSADAMSNPAAFRVYRQFVVQEGLAASWELQQLDRAIAASERAIASAERALWIPTLALRGELGHRLTKGGAGLAAPMQPGGPPPADDTTWSLSLVASLPIFLGNAPYSDFQQAEHLLAQRVTERRAVAGKIEQNIRSALHVVGASYATIALSRDAARAARENLDIVTDAYAKGAVQIVVLLDAQNASLVADESSANATYTFLADHIRAQRAAGWFDFLATPEDAAAWLERFARYRASEAAHADDKN